MSLALGLLAVTAWIYLALGRGGFWLARERDVEPPPVNASGNASGNTSGRWPSVVAVIPARNEADVIETAVSKVLAQGYAYPGPLRLIVVDDNSTDGTAEAARRAAEQMGAGEFLTVISGRPLAAGWTGKLWAVSQGVESAAAFAPDYLWLTDADIAHELGVLRGLVARAEAGKLVLVSRMARLQTGAWQEKLLIPAFVFFFDMLFPFGWVNDPRSKVAAAAGGCMLVRSEALAAAGGIAAIRSEIIDDCALAARLKSQGPIRLELTRQSTSLRPYRTLGELGRMVSRSAYAQLRYSPWLLAGTVLGMTLIFVAPPALAIAANGSGRWLGLAAWALMAIAYQPMLRYFRLSALWGLALPLIGVLYTVFTLQSAIQVWRGKGGMWKGRAQALATQA